MGFCQRYHEHQFAFHKELDSQPRPDESTKVDVVMRDLARSTIYLAWVFLAVGAWIVVPSLLFFPAGVIVFQLD